MLGCKIGVDVDLSRRNGDLPVPSRETIFLDYNFVIAGDHADRGGCAAYNFPSISMSAPLGLRTAKGRRTLAIPLGNAIAGSQEQYVSVTEDLGA